MSKQSPENRLNADIFVEGELSMAEVADRNCLLSVQYLGDLRRQAGLEPNQLLALQFESLPDADNQTVPMALESTNEQTVTLTVNFGLAEAQTCALDGHDDDDDAARAQRTGLIADALFDAVERGNTPD